MGLNKDGKPRFKKPAAGRPVPPPKETPAQFLAARRMFAIADGVLHVAEPGDARNHGEWFSSAGICSWSDGATYERIVRGFYLDRKLYAYRGRDFAGDGSVIRALTEHLPRLIDICGIPPDTETYAGATPGDVASQWRGHMHLGTVSDLVEDWGDLEEARTKA